MTYAELQQENYSYKLYEYIKSFLAVHDQVPVKVIRIDNKKKTKIVIIKQTQNGIKAISTKQFELALDDAPLFISWLKNDFPSFELEYFNYK